MKAFQIRQEIFTPPPKEEVQIYQSETFSPTRFIGAGNISGNKLMKPMPPFI